MIFWGFVFFFFNPLFLLEVNVLQANPEMVGHSEALKDAAWGWAGSPCSSPDPALPPLLPRVFRLEMQITLLCPSTSWEQPKPSSVNTRKWTLKMQSAP